MPESKYSIGGIKNGISILFFTIKEGVMDAEYIITNRFGNTGFVNEKIWKFPPKKKDEGNLRNYCAHHSMVVGMTSSMVIPDNRDIADVLPDNTNLYSRLYALKKILPQKDADILHRFNLISTRFIQITCIRFLLM